MTDTTLTPAAADLVACAHCGHLDSGTYCSACGKELADDPSRTVAHEMWDMLVVDRLNDARAFATTIGYLLAQPRRFFRTVLARPAARAGHVFPEPVPAALPKGLVQSPVTFYVLSFVTAILVGKITGEGVSGQIIRGLDDDFNNEITLLLMLLTFGVYGLAFRWASGRRISTEEAAIVSAYTMGASTTILALLSTLPGGETAGGYTTLYLMVGVPLVVLPRLYGISRRRVFVAQLGAGFVAIVALAGMILAVQRLAGMQT
ncbi:MAG TPA: hypothetical protein VLK84_17910 [Longimicrobium sp.]|nr:hypothetical protein [Longimicrobium sp.]